MRGIIAENLLVEDSEKINKILEAIIAAMSDSFSSEYAKLLFLSTPRLVLPLLFEIIEN